MSWSRFFGASTAVLLVGGCAVVALGMANADRRRVGAPRATGPVAVPRRAVAAPVTFAVPRNRAAAPRRHPHRRQLTATALHASAAPLHGSGRPTPSSTPSTPPLAPPPASTSPARTTSPATRPAPRRHRPAASIPTSPAPSSTATTPSSAAPQQPRSHDHVTRPRGRRLPLHFRTHDARQVITVVAHSRRSTTATLQAWRKVRDGRWLRRGPRIHAHIGADGMTWHASESKSATPMGSFTLTHAFGHNADPGTALPYLHTNPSDWWISQPGRLYNTHQRCSSNCPFTQGAPNEHLYYETPYYNYAVVIDYNTRNAPGGVQQGRGSAFFLHVTVGQPTAGCVAIPQRQLVSIMRWLTPARHPRILIGAT